MLITPALRRLRQEYYEFKDSLGYSASARPVDIMEHSVSRKKRLKF